MRCFCSVAVRLAGGDGLESEAWEVYGTGEPDGSGTQHKA